MASIVIKMAQLNVNEFDTRSHAQRQKVKAREEAGEHGQVLLFVCAYHGCPHEVFEGEQSFIAHVIGEGHFVNCARVKATFQGCTKAATAEPTDENIDALEIATARLASLEVISPDGRRKLKAARCRLMKNKK